MEASTTTFNNSTQTVINNITHVIHVHMPDGDTSVPSAAEMPKVLAVTKTCKACKQDLTIKQFAKKHIRKTSSSRCIKCYDIHKGSKEKELEKCEPVRAILDKERAYFINDDDKIYSVRLYIGTRAVFVRAIRDIIKHFVARNGCLTSLIIVDIQVCKADENLIIIQWGKEYGIPIAQFEELHEQLRMMVCY
jgi:hypothetical protein